MPSDLADFHVPDAVGYALAPETESCNVPQVFFFPAYGGGTSSSCVHFSHPHIFHVGKAERARPETRSEVAALSEWKIE